MDVLPSLHETNQLLHGGVPGGLTGFKLNSCDIVIQLVQMDDRNEVVHASGNKVVGRIALQDREKPKKPITPRPAISFFAMDTFQNLVEARLQTLVDALDC